MQRRFCMVLILICAGLFLFTANGWAEIGKTVETVGEGVVELPVSLVKIVGGTIKLVGEILLLPFQALF